MGLHVDHLPYIKAQAPTAWLIEVLLRLLCQARRRSVTYRTYLAPLPILSPYSSVSDDQEASLTSFSCLTGATRGKMLGDSE